MNPELVEKNRAEIVAYIQEEIAHAVLLTDNDLSPTNAARQLGRTLTQEQFERKLQTLCPRLRCEAHPGKPDKRCLYYLDSRGKTFVCSYEAGVMPEHSIFSVKTKEVWDGKTSHINKKDLPKHEITPQGVVWHGQIPGFRNVDVPWNEVKRGWRTVLIRLVGERLVTPTQVEAIFGTDNRAEWKKHMGHGSAKTPF